MFCFLFEWDIRANRIVQRYDDHMGAVNSVTFIDDCRRFVTTSDDKKILIWDYGTPVVTKHISEPHLHSVPHMSVHPSGNSLNILFLVVVSVFFYKFLI